MDIPKSITRVFTKYDPIIPKVIITTFRQIEPSVLMADAPMYKEGEVVYGEEYHLKTVEKGLEGVVFVHYARV